MPELPEVETFVRALRDPLIGRIITGVRNDWPRHIAILSAEQLRDRIVWGHPLEHTSLGQERQRRPPVERDPGRHRHREADQRGEEESGALNFLKP